MIKNQKNLKILLYLGTALLLLSACESNQQTRNIEKLVNSDKQQTTIENEGLTENERATQDLDGFLAALPGTWTRTTYPYSTYEFVGNKVKHTSEGMAEPPQFESFRLLDSCPYPTDKEQIATYPFFLVRGKNQSCSSIKLNNNFLVFGYRRSKSDSTVEEIVYDRRPSAGSTSASSKTIPKNIQGSWAISQENCEVPNDRQISINNNSIQFFDNREEINDVTQYTPRLISVSIEHRLPNSDPYPHHAPTLFEAGENGKVLIAKQYGQDYPKAIQYERCE